MSMYPRMDELYLSQQLYGELSAQWARAVGQGSDKFSAILSLLTGGTGANPFSTADDGLDLFFNNYFAETGDYNTATFMKKIASIEAQLPDSSSRYTEYFANEKEEQDEIKTNSTEKILRDEYGKLYDKKLVPGEGFRSFNPEFSEILAFSGKGTFVYDGKNISVQEAINHLKYDKFLDKVYENRKNIILNYDSEKKKIIDLLKSYRVPYRLLNTAVYRHPESLAGIAVPPNVPNAIGTVLEFCDPKIATKLERDIIKASNFLSSYEFKMLNAILKYDFSWGEDEEGKPSLINSAFPQFPFLPRNIIFNDSSTTKFFLDYFGKYQNNFKTIPIDAGALGVGATELKNADALVALLTGLSPFYGLNQVGRAVNAKIYSDEDIAEIILAQRAIRIIYYGLQAAALDTFETSGSSLYDANDYITAAAQAARQDPEFAGFQGQLANKARQDQLERLELAPQCFLIRNINKAAKLNRRRLNDAGLNKVYDYEKVRLVGKPSNIAATINQLTVNESQRNLNILGPDMLSKLIPHLRLYKTLYNKESGKVMEEVEFKFPNFTNINKSNKILDILGDKILNQYTQEYGVKSFNWELIGSDPFSYSNDINATLVLFFNDFEQLTIEREQNGIKYRMLDLLIPHGDLNKKSKSSTSSDYDYDIRVDVGWSGPENSFELLGFNTEDSIRTLFLAMTDYDIAFNPEGFFEITINYKARLEQTLYDRKMNILRVDRFVEEDLEEIDELLSELKSAETEDVEKIRELQYQRSRLVFDKKNEIYNKIVNELLDGEHIFTELVTAEEFYGAPILSRVTGSSGFDDTDAPTIGDRGTVFGTLDNMLDLNKSMFRSPVTGKNNLSVADWAALTGLAAFTYYAYLKLYDFLASDKSREKFNLQELTEADFYYIPKKTGDKYKVNYFFLGDLLEILSQITFTQGSTFSNEEVDFIKDVRIITTDFAIYDPNNITSKQVLNVNISDIPISADLFMKFYFEKVIKFDVTNYSLMKFIRDIITYCVLNIFEKCFGDDNLKTTIKTGFLDFEKIGGKDPFQVKSRNSNKGEDLDVGGVPIGAEKYDTRATIIDSYLNLDRSSSPRVASASRRDNCIHGMLLMSESFDPKQLKITNYQTKRFEDEESGLYHLDVGSNIGIVKNISFSKTDQKYLREQRFTTESVKGFPILSNVFDVTVDLIGSTLFFPGQRVYINLGERFSSLGKPYGKNSISKVMGIGGYHLITAVENEISTEGFTTKITARYETSGDGKTSDPDKVP